MILTILALLLVTLGQASEAAPDTGFDLSPGQLKRVEDGILKNRMGVVTIRVFDSASRRLEGVRVRAVQKSHDFLFGCAFPSWDIARQQPNPDDWQRFERHFLRLFNYATTENMLKWPSLERTQGSPDYSMTDHFVAWCQAHSIRIKGHCLIWGLDKGGPPAWLMDLDRDTVARLAEQRVRDVVSRYRGKIDIWDVVNEPLHCHWFETHWSPDYAALSYRWAREANPDALLVLNEYGNQWDGQAPRFVEYAAGLERKGAVIHALGEQAHDHPRIASPDELFQMLDDLAKTGKVVHLTEITMPSDGAPVKSSFLSGEWTPELQGRYYRYLYTLAFSHPAVKAITLWAMWDGASWLKEGGIISRDWTPKPAYHALDDLINREWMTSVEGRTAEDGSFTFRGFHGRYEVTLERYGKTQSTEVHIAGTEPVLKVVGLD